MVVSIGTKILDVNTIFAVRGKIASVEVSVIRPRWCECALLKANVYNVGSKIGICYVFGKLFKKFFRVSHNISPFAWLCG